MADDKTIQNDYSLTWKSLKDGRYQCLVCPHNCKLREGQRGICQARIGKSGVKLDAFGKITTAAVEPIEKKPIYHYKPNLKTLSIGGFGCSMSCDFCENWQVSQVNKFDSSEYLSPIDIINLAIKESCGAICFTYNEPIIYFEYLLELFNCAKSKNIELILKTNAYSQIPVWEKICNITSAMNIDWKGTDEQYSNFGIPDISYILDCIEYAINKTHVEISIPVYFNCSKQEHEKFSSFISRFPDVPIHLLKIYPAYKNTNTQVTSDFLLYKIKKMYKLSKYVYLQNIYQDGYQDTYCSSCFERIASRKSFVTTVYQDKCCNCTIIRT